MVLGERIAAGMRKDNVNSIGWGDSRLVDYIGGHTNLNNPHPLNVMKSACDAMERSPLFERFNRRAADIRGRDRLTRCYRLISEA